MYSCPVKKINQIIQLFQESLKSEGHDFTQGKMQRAVILLAIPMILELSLESVFAVVDMYFVGKLGAHAIATVGLTESLVTIVYSIAIGLSTAATALVSRRIGEKNPAEAARAGAQSLIISCGITIILSIVGLVWAENLLALMGASPEVIREGAIFTRIMLGGSCVIVLLFLINGIFRGAGQAAIAMRSLWIASGLNIVLCPLLIYGLDWGLAGAAIATTLGRGTGVLYQLYYLFFRPHEVRMHLQNFKPDREILLQLAKVAWPATFQFIIASASWIVLAKLVAESGGTQASAGYQIAIRNVVFFILPAWGLSNAAATLVGQNLGAQQAERAEKSVLLCMKYNVIFMSFVTLIFIFFPEQIIAWYSDEPTVIGYGVKALRTIGFGYIFYGIGMVMIQALNGAGDTKTPTWIHLICFWLFQIPLAWFLSTHTPLKTDGVFIAIPIAETLIALLGWMIFRRGHWKKIAL